MTMETKPAPTEAKAPEVQKQRYLGFPELRDELDRLWASIMAPWRPFKAIEMPGGIMPVMDVYQKNGNLQIKVELPGMKREEVEVSIENDVLVVSGEKKQESETKEADFYRSERSYGSFSRRIALPEGADAENASASFKDGVLEVTIPVRPQTPANAKKLDVKQA